MPDRYYVYIMTNRSGTLYTGTTNDLERRVYEHKRGLGVQLHVQVTDQVPDLL